MPQRKKWSSLWKTEDWWTIWLAGIIMVVTLVGLVDTVHDYQMVWEFADCFFNGPNPALNCSRPGIGIVNCYCIGRDGSRCEEISEGFSYCFSLGRFSVCHREP